MADSDAVFVRDLRLAAIIGIDPAEANIRQQVAVDLEIIAARSVAAPAAPPSVPPACGGEVKDSSAFGAAPPSVPPASGGEVKGGDSAASEAAPPGGGEDAAGRQAGKPAVDYALLIRRLRALARNERFILLEDLAAEIAALIFAEFPAAGAVKIRCAKPRLFADVAAAGVEIKRTRPSA